MTSKLTVIATITALTLSTSPALTQTGGSTAPAGPAQSEAAPTSPGAQDLDAMRAMMREMMQEMMGQQSTRNERRWDRRFERHGSARWGHGERWGRSGPNPQGQMMRGFRAGMGGGMHGARMKIMFAVVDANGDGVLALEEVQDFHGRIFNAVDQNEDGGVDMGEIESFFHGSDDATGPIADD